jgi:hypothetical protein
MTVRDAQERAVGSSVRECRCTYGRGPGSECKWKMVKKKKSVLSWSVDSDLATVFLSTKCEEKGGVAR